jgi:hypothetical protein
MANGESQKSQFQVICKNMHIFQKDAGVDVRVWICKHSFICVWLSERVNSCVFPGFIRLKLAAPGRLLGGDAWGHLKDPAGQGGCSAESQVFLFSQLE